MALVECGQLFKSVNPKAKSQSSVRPNFRDTKKLEKNKCGDPSPKNPKKQAVTTGEPGSYRRKRGRVLPCTDCYATVYEIGTGRPRLHARPGPTAIGGWVGLRGAIPTLREQTVRFHYCNLRKPMTSVVMAVEIAPRTPRTPLRRRPVCVRPTIPNHPCPSLGS
jgi:hypothetical protein